MFIVLTFKKNNSWKTLPSDRLECVAGRKIKTTDVAGECILLEVFTNWKVVPPNCAIFTSFSTENVEAREANKQIPLAIGSTITCGT